MTSQQYRSALEHLGLTQADAAEFLGVSVRSSHGYANGAPVPVAIAKLLKLTIHSNLWPDEVDEIK